MLKFLIENMLDDYGVLHLLDKMKQSELFKIENEHIFYLEESKDEILNNFPELTDVINDYGSNMERLIDWEVTQTGKNYKLGNLTIEAEELGAFLKGTTITDESSQIELFNSNKSILQGFEEVKKWAIGWLFAHEIGNMIIEAKEKGIDLETDLIKDALKEFNQ